MNKKRAVVLGTAGVVAVLSSRFGARTGLALRRIGRVAAARLRLRGGRLCGLWYRLRRRRPDPEVPDLVLADRIRSSLGPLQRRLDLPHIHVMVHDHVATLHGEVATEADRETLETAVTRVSGVRGLESYLHVGLLPSDTRPSDGRAHPPRSQARQRLEAAAERAGAPLPADRAVRAVLASFLALIPDDERDHVFAHLPADVRVLSTPPRTRSTEPVRLRTVAQLVARVAEADPDLDRQLAAAVTQSVLGELAAQLPEERRDIVAVLPAELKGLWERARTAAADLAETSPLGEPAPPAPLQLSVSGDVSAEDRAYVIAKIERVLPGTHGPVLHVSIHLERATDPARERPCKAQATLDVNGRPVRARIAAHTMTEAADLLEERLRDRLEHVAQHRRALQHRGPTSPPGQWRHGDRHEPRAPFFPRPPEEREIAHHTTLAGAPCTVDEAIFDLESMDDDFWLFTDLDTGQEAVVNRTDHGAYALHHVERPATDAVTHYTAAVEVDAHAAPPLSLRDARERLDTGPDPWVFYVDTDSGRGHVLYRRHDGHYGVISPAGPSPTTDAR